MIVYRQAEGKDRKYIKKLIGLYPKQLIQSPLPNTREFFVCEDEGKVIACCALEVYSRRLAEIRSLVVEEKYRGQGIAKKLVALCVKKAKKQKIYEILSITGAVKLFEKQGFKLFNTEKYAMLKVL